MDRVPERLPGDGPHRPECQSLRPVRRELPGNCRRPLRPSGIGPHESINIDTFQPLRRFGDDGCPRAGLFANAARDDDPGFPAEAIEFFESKIRPVLSEHCLSCHGADKQSSGLRLDSRAAVLKGGFIEGPAAFESDPDASPLVMAIMHQGGLEMPPEQTLPEPIVEDLRYWVAMGLPWTDDSTITTPEAAAGKAETHWAFQAVRKPELPEVADDSWVDNAVDAFILHRLEGAGLSPSPPADRRTLIRRATFDLIGLPPQPAEVEAFVDDPKPDDRAFAALVDRLLASPQYGERWGRHWLDVARYGDTKGYVFQEDRRYPYAYTYRDYVVRAFNKRHTLRSVPARTTRRRSARSSRG